MERGREHVAAHCKTRSVNARTARRTLTSALTEVCLTPMVPMRPTNSVSARRVASHGTTPAATIASITLKASRRSARSLMAPSTEQ